MAELSSICKRGAFVFNKEKNYKTFRLNNYLWIIIPQFRWHYTKDSLKAAKLDMASAKVLTQKDLYQPAIYHLQQTYEKCIKSYFIIKETATNIYPKRLSIITFEVA